MTLYVVLRLVLVAGLLAAWTIRVARRRRLGVSFEAGDINGEPVTADSGVRGRLLKRLLQASLVAIVGALGVGCVSAHAQSYTYVTNTDDDSLSLIYTATHEVKNPPVRAIVPLRADGDIRHYNPVATAVTPYSVAGNANGQFVYTADKDISGVSVVDVAKSKLWQGGTNPIPVGSSPVAVAISGVRLDPVGGQCLPGHPLWRTYAYVANSGDGSVSIIDTDPDSATFNQVVKTLTKLDGIGNSPSAVAVSRPTLEQADNGMFFSAGFYVYVTNAADNTVSIIDANYQNGSNGCGTGAPDDPNFHMVLGTVPVGTNPTAISFDRYGRWAYVVNSGSNDVTPIDACADSAIDQGTCEPSGYVQNFKKATSIPVGMSPSGIAITIDFTGTHKHQQFRAYVANPGDDSYSVLDVEAASPNFQKSVFLCSAAPPVSDPNCPQAGDKPTGVSVMYPDEDFVYFTNYGSNSVLVVDSDPDSLGGPGGVLQYNHVVGRIARGIGSPYPGALSGANCQPPADPAGWCGRPLGIANTPRVPYAYVMNSGTNSISVVGASPQIGDPHPILATIPLDFSPSWVTLNRNQDFIFVGDKANKKVHVINTMGQQEVGATDPTLEPMGAPLRLATPPDGWSAYVTADDGNVYAIDTVDRSAPGGPGDPFGGGGGGGQGQQGGGSGNLGGGSGSQGAAGGNTNSATSAKPGPHVSATGSDVTFPIPGAPGFAPMLVHQRQCSTGDPTDVANCANGKTGSVIPSVGSELGGMDVHPDNFYALVASRGTDQVAIVDTHYDRETWNSVVGSVQGLPAGSNPNAVAFTHVGDRALILNGNASCGLTPTGVGSLSLVDTSGDYSTWHVINTIPVGACPMAVAFAEHDLHAYVTNSNGGTVSVIDLNSFTVLTTVTVGANPQDVFINLGERVAAYVTNMGSDTISIIDDQPDNPTFNTVIATVTLPPGSKPVGIILTEP
jgi:YVTN family beta-propeller protein